MGMQWTDEQQKVLASRGGNLLVSAAAGSGKTAVLVARIIEMISDPIKPIDVDRLLIVTFTKAAAAEMRERIYRAIQSELEQHPENQHLRRQLTLVRKAQISTIDSFCSYVVRSYFYALDLDPAFRVADEGELRLLQSDVLDEILEEEYAKGDEAFINLMEELSTGKTDEVAKEMILKLFRTSQSAPWPEEWLEKTLDAYEVETVEDLKNKNWYAEYLNDQKSRLESIAEQFRRLKQQSYETGLEHLVPTFQADEDLVGKVAGHCLEDDRTDYYKEVTFAKKATVPKGADKDKDKEFAKKRNKLKGSTTDLIKKLSVPLENIVEDLKGCYQTAGELVRVTRIFSQRFAEQKKARSIADFSDLEHMTLELLLDHQNHQRTDIARQLSEQFDEIMIDEYQDSNSVQEEILKAVSTEADGKPNTFMVGDVKQSIYRFRMANPNLFMEKYDRYTEEGSYRKIELTNNFRSRLQVLEDINLFFRQLMQRDVGNIEYTEDHALHHGFEPFTEEEQTRLGEKAVFGGQTEIMLFEKSTLEFREDITDEKAGEALMVAQEIRRLTDPAAGRVIYDTAEKRLRPICYGDIAILLRASSGWDTVFMNALEEQGIPAYTEGGKGYFNTREVTLILNLLQVIDNPLNDIPLAAVLHSPLFAFSTEELSKIRLSDPEMAHGLGFYGSLKLYIEKQDSDPELKKRLSGFLEKVESYRGLSEKLSLAMLIRRIYEDTGLPAFAAALAGGERRAANLKKLVDKAEDFENTSYQGIFHFIRYIEKLKDYKVEEGEASGEGAGNAVRIMTIHKSKGLEFPVVFTSGCGKGFNAMDERTAMVVHQTLGLGINRVDSKDRVRYMTLIKSAIAEKLHLESLGEELRVLYVALTRAREKLYITGAVDNRDEVISEYGERWSEPESPCGMNEIMNAGSYLDWILMTYKEDSDIVLSYVNEDNLDTSAIEELAAGAAGEQALEAVFGEHVNKQVYEKVQSVLKDTELKSDLYKVHPTYSVSALKAADFHGDDKEQPRPNLSEDKENAEKESVMTGAQRGTLYHLMLELADPHGDLSKQAEDWVKEGLISQVEKDTIQLGKIKNFFDSALGQRFIKALDAGRGYRERQFIAGIPVKQIKPELRVPDDKDERLMIQGIIDMYFEEDDGLVIVDYKTDRVDSGDELVKRYHLQLELYAQALSMALGKKVKETWIYSLKLEKEIRV